MRTAATLRIPINLGSLDASNMFLRALWAQMRREFGSLAWSMAPRRTGSERVIYFGWAQLGTPAAGTVRVAVHYQRKGVIHSIIFTAEASLYKEIPDLDTRLKLCVNTALNPDEAYKPTSRVAQVTSTPRLLIAHYRGSQWYVGPLSNDTSEIGLYVGAFDDIDALYEFKLCLENVLNVLSVWTNCSFKERRPDRNASALDTEIADFWTDTDWIDDHPVVGERLLLEQECIAFIDDIVSRRIDGNDPLFRAARLFHQGVSVANGELDLGDLAAVLFISALECLSEGEPTTCKECGQPVYKISERVVYLGIQHLGDAAAQLFKRHYSSRSRYLHSGRMVGLQPKIGQSVPQLDPEAAQGCALDAWSRPHNLLEFVSFVMRGEIRNRFSTGGA
jgi:hypothetical protein